MESFDKCILSKKRKQVPYLWNTKNDSHQQQNDKISVSLMLSIINSGVHMYNMKKEIRFIYGKQIYDKTNRTSHCGLQD